MSISKKHTNRKPHNWLIYNINDNFLDNAKDKYKGILYDLGCGESPYKDFFMKYSNEYKGVDWSASQHQSSAEIVADLNEILPIKSEVADTVISLSVMEHLREPQTMLNEAYRILKQEGYLVAQVPWQWQIHEAPYDFFRYTPYGLKYMLEKAGFSEITITPQAGFFSSWFIKANYFSLRFIMGPAPLRTMIKAILIPFWTIGQLIAPILDKLDKNWQKEATGYFITAKKL